MVFGQREFGKQVGVFEVGKRSCGGKHSKSRWAFMWSVSVFVQVSAFEVGKRYRYSKRT